MSAEERFRIAVETAVERLADRVDSDLDTTADKLGMLPDELIPLLAAELTRRLT